MAGDPEPDECGTHRRKESSKYTELSRLTRVSFQNTVSSSSYGQEEDFKCVCLCASQEEKAFRGGRTIRCQVCSPCAFSRTHEEIITITTWELTVCSGCIFCSVCWLPSCESTTDKNRMADWSRRERRRIIGHSKYFWSLPASDSGKRLLYVSNTLLEHNPQESDRHKWMQCSNCFRENDMTVSMLGLASQKRVCIIDLWLLFTNQSGQPTASSVVLVYYNFN